MAKTKREYFAELKNIVADNADVILANLTEPMTCSAIQKEILGDYDLKNQRVSAILKQLVDDNSIVRTVVKRTAYFGPIAD